MNKLIFGFDQFKEDGDPLPNLENFEFDNKKICKELRKIYMIKII